MRWCSVIVAALGFGLAAVEVVNGQVARPGIAVLSFRDGGSYGLEPDDFEALQVGLQQMLITELAVNSKLRIIERRRIRELPPAPTGGAATQVDADAAARIGVQVGARYVVVGGFVDLYEDFRIDMQIVNVETGEIVRSERVLEKRENLYRMVVDLANQITRGLNLDPLSRQALNQRRNRNIPEQAVRLYAKGLISSDRGDTQRAAEFFSQAKELFPDYVEADRALKRIGPE